jgi:hypothetical protein
MSLERNQLIEKAVKLTMEVAGREHEAQVGVVRWKRGARQEALMQLALYQVE